MKTYKLVPKTKYSENELNELNMFNRVPKAVPGETNGSYWLRLIKYYNDKDPAKVQYYKEKLRLEPNKAKERILPEPGVGNLLKRVISPQLPNFSESDLGLDVSEEKFKGPKDAIKWCNEKFKELKDIKYKQIANYLHIYL